MDYLYEILEATITSKWFIGLLVAYTIYVYATWNFNHWQKMGVACMRPLPFVGNAGSRLYTSFSDVQEWFYNSFKGHKVAGIYGGRRPILLVRDPDIIKQLLIRDFDCFTNRPMPQIHPDSFEENNLLVLKDAHWKELRNLATPVFTSGKIKSMSNLITNCTEHMTNHLNNNIFVGKDRHEFDMKDFFGRFTLDSIACCAFGTQLNSQENPNCEFVKAAYNFDKSSWLNSLKLFLTIVIMRSERLARMIGARLMNKSAVDYLGSILVEGKKRREHTPSGVNHDFLQLMMDAQAGKLKNVVRDNDTFAKDAELKNFRRASPEAMTDELVLGFSFMILIAGYETTSTTLSFAAYELALNPEMQDRAREEVQRVLKKYGGKCGYEAISEMTYLDNIFHETLRKYPPVAAVPRVCTTDKYQVEGTNAVLYRDDMIFIPVRGLHYDEQYYPDPHKFDPDRFLPENKAKRSTYSYLPFGTGPRNCIGMRFAMMNMKMAMSTLLKSYRLETCDRTSIPFSYMVSTVFLNANGGVPLHVTKL